MDVIVFEVRRMKRLSKKVKTKYTKLNPGRVWFGSFGGEKLVMIASNSINTGPVYVGMKGGI